MQPCSHARPFNGIKSPQKTGNTIALSELFPARRVQTQSHPVSASNCEQKKEGKLSAQTISPSYVLFCRQG
jgi:hypothetical protein